MALVLPSTVEELNYIQNSLEFIMPPPPNYQQHISQSNKGFENIAVERRYKREVSLPNEVENWNIGNIDPYLNFDDNIQQQNTYKVISQAQNDRLVPEEGELRQRCGSFSSVSSNMEDKCMVYHNLGVRKFNTVCMDSGSTCISSDHTYVNPSQVVMEGLDAEETYQNLDTFFKQEPEINPAPSISSISPVGSPMNDSNLEYSILSSRFSVSSNCSQDSFSEQSSVVGLKRSATDLIVDDDLFLLGSPKRTCESPNSGHFYENRKKNNMSSKNCRKTRKEKQKDMEKRVGDLEKEREELKSEVQILEEMINAHKLKLYAILQQKR